MADIAAIRTGMAANLSAIPDLQVSPYVLSNPQLPSAVILAGGTEFDAAFARGLDKVTILVRLVVAAVTDIGSGVNLDPYLAGSGPRSVKAAVEADKTLAGACLDLRVTGHEGEQVYTFGEMPPALGAQWTVEVTAHGT